MMTTDTALLEKREYLKHGLTTGTYNPLLMRWVDRTGYLIQRLFRNSGLSSYWFGAVVLTVIPIMISSVASLLLSEFQTSRRELSLLEFWGTLLLFLTFVVHKFVFVVIFTTLQDHLLDTIETVSDLVNVQRWLVSLSTRSVLFFGLTLGIFVTGVANCLIYMPTSSFIPIGPTLFTLISWLMGGMAIYHLFQIWAWFVRFDQYQFKLYAVDPASSEVVGRMSSMLRKLSYLFAAYGIGFTVFFTMFDLTTLFWIIFQIVVVWGPVIATFVSGQYSLTNIITNAKWKNLNNIQAHIKALEEDKKFPNKEILEAINQLMDYHNRIMTTRSSAIDLRASLNFLNSLLIPLFAFILANLEKIFDFFH